MRVEGVTMSESKGTVLIVEDDESFGYAAARHLEKAGYQSIVTQSSMVAMEELDKQRIDVVVTDIKLAKGEPHGLALARIIQNKFPGTSIILVTAYPELLDSEVAVPGTVLHKPVDLAALTREVASHC
jgi:two-component system response regulator GlrR